MSQFYEFVQAGDPLISVAEMKAYLKVTSSSQDALIESLIDAATEWVESYTARDFRDNTHRLYLDCFFSRTCITKDPVDQILSVSRISGGVDEVVDPSVYYLKRHNTFSEVLLAGGQSWPNDVDPREQAIKVEIKTKPHYRANMVKNALMKHIAHWFTNRGDCDTGGSGGCTCSDAAKASGAMSVYNQVRIARV